MLVLTYGLAVPVMWFASKEWDERGRYFHAMCHFLLMGLTGAFQATYLTCSYSLKFC